MLNRSEVNTYFCPSSGWPTSRVLFGLVKRHAQAHRISPVLSDYIALGLVQTDFVAYSFGWTLNAPPLVALHNVIIDRGYSLTLQARSII